MTAPVLSIIIISYNTKQMTLDCIASVYAETKTPFELIVVDNASTDGSAEAIAKAFPQTMLIAETTNHGFAPGHKVALPHATAPWLLLLNPDTLVLDGALDKLLAFAERTPGAGIWGARTLFGDKSLNATNCWAKMTLWSTVCRVLGLSAVLKTSETFNSESYGTWDRSSERQVDIVTGCLFLMRRADWDDLGGFDDAFVMYGEETDLCLRAADQKGFKPRVTADAEIIHYGGASEAVRADKMCRLMRAKMELIKRHFPTAQRGIGQWLFARWPRSRQLAWVVISTLTGKESHKAKANTWGEIWDRRSEWLNGYS